MNVILVMTIDQSFRIVTLTSLDEKSVNVH